MYKPQFNKRPVLVFRQFGNKGYSLFACIGREVVCSVLSVATLTYASAESVSTHAVTTDTVAVHSDREMMLDEVSVTGTRAPLTKSQAARMVTVLDRSDIQQAPVQSVNDLLKYAVGVDVRQRGALGAQTDVSIRGGTQEQIIVLLNGVNICDPQTAHNTVDLPVDLADIERVEIIEGPAGRLYGTSSLVGAINFVTKTPRPSHTEGQEKIHLRAEGGSYGYLSTAARLLLPTYRGGGGALSASYSRSDGYSRSKAGTLNTGYSGTKAFYQGCYATDGVNVGWHMGLSDRGWGSATFYATPRWPADDQYEHTTKTVAALQADVRTGTLVIHPTIYWNHNYDRYEGYHNRPDLLPYNYNRTDIIGLSMNSYFDWVAGRTAIGAELRNEDLVSANLGETLSRQHHIGGTNRYYTLGINRTNISTHIEHNVLLPHFTLSAGLVAVRNSWSNMNMSVFPGADVTLRIGSCWKLHASANTSLRMPSFTEMYYKLQGYSANPHLKPEEMRAIEVGATYTVRNTRSDFQLSLWHHHGSNMIDWVMDTRLGDDAIWQSVNHTRINSIGAELSARLDCTALLPAQHVLKLITVNYSYISQEKKEEEYIVSQYALEYLRHKLVAKADVQIVPKLMLALDLRWQDRVGQYTDFDGNVCDYKPFCLLNARICWQASHYALHLEANNLLGTHYVDYGHVPQPGTWITCGFTFTH